MRTGYRWFAFLFFFTAFILCVGHFCQGAVPADISAQSQNAVVKAVKLVGPAVVNIDTTYRSRRTGSIFDLFPEFLDRQCHNKVKDRAGYTMARMVLLSLMSM